MTQNQPFNAAESEGGTTSYQYVIDVDAAQEHGRAMSVLIASRRCYQDQQSDDGQASSSLDPQDHIDRIVEHCAQTPDYLLPDTPLKEAIFRVILGNGNTPTTAEEISELLSEKWAMTAYPRDLSPHVIGRLLENSESYCIVRVATEEQGQDALAEPSAEEPDDEGEAE